MRMFGNLAPDIHGHRGKPSTALVAVIARLHRDTGGTPTRVNLANRTVSIGLDGGEAIVCTFTNTYDVDTHRRTTRGVVSHFIVSRINFLAAYEPRSLLPSGACRALWGDDLPRVAPRGRPRAVHCLGQHPGCVIARVIRDQPVADQRQSRGRSAQAVLRRCRPGASRHRGRRRGPAEPASIDIWTEAHYADVRARPGGVQSRGQFGVAYFGADVMLGSSAIAGGLVQLDWGRETNAVPNSRIDGNGVMVGPYLSSRLAPSLFFDARAAWGMSSNHVSPFGTYRDGFRTERWLASSKLTGNWNAGDVRFTPSAGVIMMRDRQVEYVDNMGFTIPSQTLALGRVTFGRDCLPHPCRQQHDVRAACR